MTSADVTAHSDQSAPPPYPSARGLHVIFIVVWSALLAGAILAFGYGTASNNQTYDLGPLTHEAQAGVDYIAAGILAATGLIILMVQLGVRIVQLTLSGRSTT
jgi:hypothetical protein